MVAIASVSFDGENEEICNEDMNVEGGMKNNSV